MDQKRILRSFLTELEMEGYTRVKKGRNNGTTKYLAKRITPGEMIVVPEFFFFARFQLIKHSALIFRKRPLEIEEFGVR